MLTANTLASLKLNLNPKLGITFFSSDDDDAIIGLMDSEMSMVRKDKNGTINSI